MRVIIKFRKVLQLARIWVQRPLMDSFSHQWLYSPLLGPGRFLNFVILYTVGRTPGTGSACHKAFTYTRKNINRINAHRHSCLGWDSNPRPRRLSRRRRFMLQTMRPPCSALLWIASTVLSTSVNTQRNLHYNFRKVFCCSWRLLALNVCTGLDPHTCRCCDLHNMFPYHNHHEAALTRSVCYMQWTVGMISWVFTPLCHFSIAS
jgi:hypothetical protein